MAAGLSGVFPYEDDHPVWRERWSIGPAQRPTPQPASTTEAPDEEPEQADEAPDEQHESEPKR